MAHKANVNCLAMGHKSNQVLATGGDDKKVNLWAIGRQSCLMVCYPKPILTYIKKIFMKMK